MSSTSSTREVSERLRHACSQVGQDLNFLDSGMPLLN